MRTTEVKSAARILDILELLAATPRGIRLNELARALDIPKSSASALMSTLVARGYVDAGPDGYCLAVTFRAANWVGGVTGVLMRAAYPIMEKLVTDTGESSFLGVSTPAMDVRYLAKVVSANPLRYDVELDTGRPAHSTSIGQVLLASLSNEALDDYFRTHALDQAKVGERAIRRAVARARREGYVTIADSHVVGTSGAAAPVVANGRTIAGLAVIAPSVRFDAARERIVPKVVAAARDLGHAIDGTAGAFVAGHVDRDRARVAARAGA